MRDDGVAQGSVLAHDGVEAEAEPKPLLAVPGRGRGSPRAAGPTRREAGVLPQGGDDLVQELREVVDELERGHRLGRERSLHLRLPAPHDIVAFGGEHLVKSHGREYCTRAASRILLGVELADEAFDVVVPVVAGLLHELDVVLEDALGAAALAERRELA